MASFAGILTGPAPAGAAMSSDAPASIRVGPAGWRYDDWAGRFYPTGARRLDALDYVASYFTLVEVDSTFYRVPPPRIARSWVRRTAHRDAFTFTVKAHRDFTHAATLATARDAAAFRRAVEPLAEAGRLGAVLLQYPWRVRATPDGLARIAASVRALEGLPLAVEVRHGSWQRDGWDARLADLGVTVCGVDQPAVGDSVRPDTGHPGPAGGYVRLHGRNRRAWFARDAGRDARYDWLYAIEDLEPWVRRVRGVAAPGRPVHVVFNNHFRGQAPANALMFRARLEGRPVRAPATLRRAIPDLAPWTRGDDASEPSLFD